MSPFLFVLALEPLAYAICTNTNISGIPMYDYNFKLNLHADDILVTLKEPSVSFPALLALVESFSHLSGYKINWGKSEAMPLNQYTFQLDVAGTPFVWKNKGKKYLGINIISLIIQLFNLNGPNLLKLKGGWCYPYHYGEGLQYSKLMSYPELHMLMFMFSHPLSISSIMV